MNIISKSLLTLSLGTLVSFASAADEHGSKKVDVKDLPAPVAAALAKSGEVKEVTQKERDGKVVYKAEVKTADGKTENVWVDEKGSVIKDAGKAAEHAAKDADKAADKAEKAADKAGQEANKAADKAKDAGK